MNAQQNELYAPGQSLGVLSDTTWDSSISVVVSLFSRILLIVGPQHVGRDGERTPHGRA
jgi:hypothetical protein